MVWFLFSVLASFCFCEVENQGLGRENSIFSIQDDLPTIQEYDLVSSKLFLKVPPIPDDESFEEEVTSDYLRLVDETNARENATESGATDPYIASYESTSTALSFVTKLQPDHDELTRSGKMFAHSNFDVSESLYRDYGVQAEQLMQPLLVGADWAEGVLYYRVLANTPHGRHLLMVSLLEQLDSNVWTLKCGGKLEIYLPKSLRLSSQPPPPPGACVLDNIMAKDRLVSRREIQYKFDWLVPLGSKFTMFSWFIKEHRAVMHSLTDWVLEQQSFGSSYSLLVTMKDMMNKVMFAELVNLVMAGRKDTGFIMPSYESYMPEAFFPVDSLAPVYGMNEQVMNKTKVRRVRRDVESFNPWLDWWQSTRSEQSRVQSPSQVVTTSSVELDWLDWWQSTPSKQSRVQSPSQVVTTSPVEQNTETAADSIFENPLTIVSNQQSGSNPWLDLWQSTPSKQSRVQSPSQVVRTSRVEQNTETAADSIFENPLTIVSNQESGSNPWLDLWQITPSKQSRVQSPSQVVTTSPVEQNTETAAAETIVSNQQSSRNQQSGSNQQRVPHPGDADMLWTRQSPHEAEWYFREDPVANSHHTEWHRNGGWQFQRWGEHFYFMHGQMQARYEAERLSLGMGLVDIFGPSQWRGYISDSYDPRLGDQFRPRPAGTLDPGHMLSLNRSITRQIQGYLDGGWAYGDGVDWLINSLGENMAPNLHNVGHAAIMQMSVESRGVMGSSIAAMRDPIFYRWHAYIETLFKEYKNGLGFYQDEDLGFPDITSVTASVQSNDGDANILYTYREMALVTLDSLATSGPGNFMSMKYSRMNHRPFTWNMVITSRVSTPAIVRIFMLPTNGEHNRATIHMDHFFTNLDPGENIITRDELDAPHLSKSRWSLNQLQKNLMKGQVSQSEFSWGGCGWPRHLNIPRGTEKGMAWTMVVMVSKVLARDMARVREWNNLTQIAWSYCGVRSGRVPDSRPLGFPVDRNFGSIHALVEGRSNYAVVPVTILHGQF